MDDKQEQKVVDDFLIEGRKQRKNRGSLKITGVVDTTRVY